MAKPFLRIYRFSRSTGYMVQDRRTQEHADKHEDAAPPRSAALFELLRLQVLHQSLWVPVFFRLLFFLARRRRALFKLMIGCVPASLGLKSWRQIYLRWWLITEISAQRNAKFCSGETDLSDFDGQRLKQLRAVASV